jgi:phosphohistidine swiveling domain-containing protein
MMASIEKRLAFTSMSAWQPIIRRPGVSVLFQSYINQGYTDPYYEEILGIPHGLGSHRYVDGWVIVHNDEAEAFTAKFIPRLDEPAYVRYFLERCKQVSNDLLATGAAIRKRGYDDAGNAELLFDFMTFGSQSIRVMPFLNTMVFVQDAIEERVLATLSRHYGLNIEDPDLHAHMQRLMAEGSQTPLASQAVAELSRLAAQIRTEHPVLGERLQTAPDSVTRADLKAASPEVEAAFDNYLAAYDFLNTNYYLGSPTTLADLCRQLGSFEPKDTPLPSGDIEASLADLNSDDRELLDTAQHLQYLREYRLEALYKAGRDAHDLLNRIGESLGTSYEETVYMTFSEIQKSLTAREPAVDLPAINARMVDYASCVEDGEAKFVIGKGVEDLRAELPVRASASDNLLGTTAYPGDYIGTARIVSDLPQVQDVQVGDVLVAPMTMPYHVPAMARSGAVITDEGGILSHAAIVARELRIPCIVGLGSATTAFRNGEELRVHAASSGGRVERATT